MIVAVLLAASLETSSASMAATPCRAARLRLSLDGRDGDFDGMSHSGTELLIRNLGQDCVLPALPRVVFRNAHGTVLRATRRAPPDMHPASTPLPVRLASGKRAVIGLRWVSGPVFAHSRALHARSATVRIGDGTLRVPLDVTLYGEAGRYAGFDQTPARAAEGMAAG